MSTWNTFHFLPDFNLPRRSQAVLTFSKSEIHVDIRIVPKNLSRKEQRQRHWAGTRHFDFIPCIFSAHIKNREWKSLSERDRCHHNKNTICSIAKTTGAVI